MFLVTNTEKLQRHVDCFICWDSSCFFNYSPVFILLLICPLTVPHSLTLPHLSPRGCLHSPTLTHQTSSVCKFFLFKAHCSTQKGLSVKHFRGRAVHFLTCSEILVLASEDVLSLIERLFVAKSRMVLPSVSGLISLLLSLDELLHCWLGILAGIVCGQGTILL